MKKFSQGKYVPENPSKYIGKSVMTYRSSWELAFAQFCDKHPAVINWASESIHIPYFNPFTKKNTIYVPDFFVIYQDKNGKKHAELVEIKPSHEVMETVGKGIRNQAVATLNQCKWEAAQRWCKANGVTFRVVTEHDMFANTKKAKKPKSR